MIRTSPSAIASFATCERLWWLEQVYRIEPVALRLDATVSRCVHSGLKHFLGMGRLDEGAARAVARFRGMLALRPLRDSMNRPVEKTPHLIGEQSALIEGAIHAWNRVRGEAVRGRWEIDRLEDNIAVAIADDVTMVARPDIVAFERDRGAVAVFDFKMVDRPSATYLGAFQTSVQMLCYLWAIEKLYAPLDVSATHVEIIVRGDRRRGKDGIAHQGAPWCYGWSSQPEGPYYPELMTTRHVGRLARVDLWTAVVEGVPDVVRWWATTVSLLSELEEHFLAVTQSRLPPTVEAAARDMIIYLARRAGVEIRTMDDCPPTGMAGGRCGSKMGRCLFYDLCYRPELLSIARTLRPEPPSGFQPRTEGGDDEEFLW
jgi:hypothetical protein